MKKIAILCLTGALAVMLGGCSYFTLPNIYASSGSSTPQTSSQTVSVEANSKLLAKNNNLAHYLKAGGKTYTTAQLQKVYIPYTIQMLMSSDLEIDDITKQLPMNFNRNNGNVYYNYYKSGNSELYVFYTESGDVKGMLNLSNMAINAISLNNLTVGTATFEDVAAIDKSAILYDKMPEMIDEKTSPVTQASSEHIMENGDIITVKYNKVNGKQVVASVTTATGVAKTLLNLILNIDK